MRVKLHWSTPLARPAGVTQALGAHRGAANFGSGVRILRRRIGGSMSHRARLLALSLAFSLLACSEEPLDLTGPIEGWSAYGNDAGGMRFSKLTQITPENVGELDLAWIHRSGDVLDGSASLGKSSLQVTPIIAAGTRVYI
jgi:glucose dehydrogenase